jgi:hypothetical protein
MRGARLAPAAALFVFVAAHAGDIYRWVDENGRTQMSDQVPEKYRASAKHLGDSRQYELTPEQRKEADARAATARAREDAEARARADAAARPAAAEKAAAPASGATQAGEEVEPNTISAAECAAWWREYMKNMACYGPFHNVNGSMKPGAFEACGLPVRNPSRQCARYK